MSAALHAPALEARGLSVSLDGTRVLHGIDLKLQAGRWTCLVGPNGAGKSTLLKALCGLLPAEAGQAFLEGVHVEHLPARTRAQRLAWLGQGESASEDLRVYDLVMLGRLPHQGWLATPGPADHAAVERGLRATQAWDWRDRALGHLSGGERQRVLLARALAVEAGMLVMDEPLSNLDPPHQVDCLLLVRQLVDRGVTVVTVLHELPLALHAQELVVMAKGRIVHHGSSQSPETHRALEAVFDQRIRIQAHEGQWLALPRL